MRVVADAGPLHYLVLIGQIDILPQLFGTIFVPAIVSEELDRSRTPPSVRAWIGAPPYWLSVVSGSTPAEDASLAGLDAGERAAIELATAIQAELLLMDDRSGVAAGRARGIAVTGTLGLLDRAARRGMVNLAEAFAALQNTNFHIRPDLLGALLDRWRKDAGTK